MTFFPRWRIGEKVVEMFRDGYMTVPAGLVRSCTALPAMRYLCAHAQD